MSALQFSTANLAILSSARIATKSVIPMVSFWALEESQRDRSGRFKPIYKRVHGIIGTIPIYNITRYRAINADRPLHYRPSDGYYKSTRQGDSLNKVRITMMVTGKFALSYIRSLELLKKAGSGSLLSKVSMNSQGVPSSVTSQLGLPSETRISPFGEFTYPFISRTDLFSHAQITSIEKIRKVEHGINFAYEIVLEITKVIDPYIVPRGSLSRGAFGFNLDEISSTIWSTINSVGVGRGAEAKITRFRRFGVSEQLLLSGRDPILGLKLWAEHPDWGRVARDPYQHTYRYEETPHTEPVPKITVPPIDVDTGTKEEIEDPSGRYSGIYTLVYDNTNGDGGLHLSSFPVRLSVTKETVVYTLDLDCIPRVPSLLERKHGKTINIMFRCRINARSSEDGTDTMIGMLALQKDTVYNRRDTKNGFFFRLILSNVSWNVVPETSDVSLIPIRFKVSCAVV